MTRLVSIDPGLRGTGVALFEGGRLTMCWYPRVKGKERGPGQWRAMASAVDNARIYSLPLAIEYPQAYTAGRQKGDQNDLLELAGVVGAIVGMLDPSEVTGYLPREWKGQVDPDVMLKRIVSKLDAQERAVLEACDVPASLAHNVIDSVGVGLFHLKRLHSGA